MANPEHLQILQQGVKAWNAWREHNRDITPDLSEAHLVEAHLVEADLTDAYLRRVHFGDAYLLRTNFTRAKLITVNFNLANLTGADLSHVELYETIFSATNLTAVRGLETCVHFGPSTLDRRTLVRSGPLPLVFLRGCGLSDWEIEASKLYNRRLTSGDVTDILYRIHHLRTDPLIQFSSCFISYASRDQAFAKRLYADLQNKGVRCWYAPEDMKIGDEFRSRIDASIYLHDRLLLILSEHSLQSRWVQKEVETAFEKEEQENRLVLFPLRLDEAVMHMNVGWAADIRRQRHIGDFTHWKKHDAYQQALARLLRDLTVEDRKPGIGASQR
jgi:TIR domain/Pentapeptide repeats (9 copies)